MSALPKAVQAQLDQAEALQAQLTGEAAPDAGNTVQPEAVVAPVEQLVEPEVQQTQVTQQPSSDWEQRFKVLEGKYRNEVPRLHESNRELSERLEQAIKALEAKQEEPKKDTKLVTDADVAAFGEDLVDMVRRAAREEFDILASKFAADMDKRFGAVAEKVERTEKRQVMTETEKFWAAVSAQGAAPDFEQVNTDPRWFAFLDSRVPGTRFTRRALAEDAINNLDAQALIEQVKAFKESVGEVAPVEPPVPPKKKPNVNVQVAPNSSSASAPSVQTGKVWTAKAYQEALDHRNLQRMTRAEYDALVAEAEQAYAEGRVQF